MSKTPVGEVRPSQLLWTYGPGALIDLPNLSVVTMGIDRWELGRCQPIQEARLLTNSQSTVPRWSPDGRQIAFSPVRSYDGGVFVISADGSAERRLTNSGSWPVWSPDGKQIVYLTVGPDGNEQARVIPPAGGASKVLEGLQFLGINYPIDLFSNNLLVTTNAVHLSSEIWLLQ